MASAGKSLLINFKERIKKMKKYILTLGLNDKDTCKPAFTEGKAVEMVCNLLLQRGFKGASITSGRGFYQMESMNLMKNYLL